VNHSSFLLSCALLIASSSCVRKIPGTEIDDTSDTRAVLDVVERYRGAVEQRNAPDVVALIDDKFHDDAGTGTAEDDLDYKSLASSLPGKFQKLDDVKLDLSVRRIEFENDNQAVRVTYTYNLSFRIPQLSAKPQNESDIKQMMLHRVDKSWKILSGI
jgi:hypothetical protein